MCKQKQRAWNCFQSKKIIAVGELISTEITDVSAVEQFFKIVKPGYVMERYSQRK